MTRLKEDGIFGLLMNVVVSPTDASQSQQLENTASRTNWQMVSATGNGGSFKHKLYCFLCSVERDEEEDESGGEISEIEPAGTDSFRFDYILVRGTKELKGHVLSWMESCFDSTISKRTLLISPEHLSRTARALTQSSIQNYTSLSLPKRPETSEQEYRKGDKFPVSFVFSLPNAVKEAGLSQITLGLPETALQILHLALDGEDIQEEAFLGIIIDYFSQYTNIDLAGASLTKLETPLVEIDAGGQVKFADTRVVPEVLLELANICRTFELGSPEA